MVWPNTEVTSDMNRVVHMNIDMLDIYDYVSSSSLACVGIWGPRYSCLSSSSMLPCLLCPLSAPPVSYLSHKHLSNLGLASLFFFSLACPHIGLLSSSWPYHFSRFSVIFLDACATLVVPLMCSFRSDHIPPYHSAHLSILISFTSSCASCPLVVAHVSAPYNRASLTTVL